MNANTHIIQKQFVELTVSKRDNSLVLQQQFEKMLEEELIPRLEPVFDSLSGPGESVELGRLDVDLGYLEPLHTNRWLEKTYHEVVKAVNSAVQKAKTHLPITSQAPQDAILFFLHHGYLPWWALELKMDKAIQKLMASSPEKLLSCLQVNKARKRWVKQFGQEVQKALLNALAVSPPFSYAEWKDIVLNSFTPVGPVNQRTERMLVEIYWETVWEALLQPNKTHADVIREVLDNFNTTQTDFKRWILQSESVRSFMDSAQAESHRQKENKTPPHSKNPAAREEIYVLLAGIGLIHPFLPAFFEKLHLLEGDQYKDEAAREKAVHLLYFLATGREHPDEPETVVLKLLCGMDIETPILKELDLKEEEKTESIHLLESFIHHWKELEGSTPDELRGSFFVREGKLTRGDMGWYLKVEEKTYDILLSKLPWGISPIMHTWMHEMLWVEWD